MKFSEILISEMLAMSYGIGMKLSAETLAISVMVALELVALLIFMYFPVASHNADRLPRPMPRILLRVPYPGDFAMPGERSTAMAKGQS